MRQSTAITKKDNKEELLPLVDEFGNVIGKATRGECHGGSMKLHPVVHLHIFDSRGNLYLQKRPQWKDIQPGKWDTAVGGHIDYGEQLADAICRETREEVGLIIDSPIKIASYVFESERERELVNVFAIFTDVAPRPSDELDGGQFWSIDEIESALGSDVLTPNFEKEFVNIIRPFVKDSLHFRH